MGRALFSTMYTQSVAVRTEPDVPPHSDRPTCEKWSISNPFDPDSDEFYEGATREVFTDTEAWREEQEAVRELLAAQAHGRIESSSSSETSESDSGSPMAVGSDDPAQLFADAFYDADWRPHLAAIGVSPEWVARHTSAMDTELTSQLRVSNMELAIQPSASPPQSPTFQRTVPITPISIPDEPSHPGPPSPAPATPHMSVDNVYMLTPSPPPSVTPHVYSWPFPLAAQSSPLANRNNPAGPLTNPAARLSFVMLNTTPVRVRVQNTAV